MNQPSWKKLLSYLVEFHIESAPSEINPHLYVSLRNGRYQLCTANAVYSYDDLYDNFTNAFDRIGIESLEKKNVLILGLGLGSVPFMLEKKYGKKWYYTAVEIDENVIYLAEKYVISNLNSPIQTICADAFAFVHQCQEKFDLIAMDVFLDDVVPSQFTSEDFLTALKDLLSDDGILLYNRLALTKKDLAETQLFYENYFKKVFPNGDKMDVGGNWMLINSKL